MSQELENPLVHLHIHSEYSLLDGAIKVSDLVKKAKADGQTTIALTDHGNLYAAIEFYSKCKENGIKPIIGCELFTSGVLPAKDKAWLLSKLPSAKKNIDCYHITLLAKNLSGYQNLMKLSSFGFLDNQGKTSEIPVVHESFLEKHKDGLIALSSCLLGELGVMLSVLKQFYPDSPIPFEELKHSSESDAHKVFFLLSFYMRQMKTRYGEDFYVEIIDNNLPDQKALIPELVNVAKYFQIPVVATADAHYLNPDDSDAHSVLLAIKHNHKTYQFQNRRKSARFHFLKQDELRAVYAQYPEALDNTRKIAEKCDLKLEFGKYFLPQFPMPQGETADSFLRKLSRQGLIERFEILQPLYGESFNAEKQKVYWDRLDFELDVIIKMGFPGYFLIVQDFINWAKSQDIPVGPGRGSGAGSLVAYALKITDLDPLPYNLVFERFLNPERVSMPDFDVDFCQDRRDEVIKYVTQKYGKEHVAQITTFGKMLAKAVVRDVGRAMDLTYKRVDKIAKLIPDELGITLDDALEKEPRIRQEMQADDRVEQLITYALKLEGLSRHTSVHAAGIVISDGPMMNYVPVYKPQDTDLLVTQYEMKNAEKVGLIKFDFLGLKTLTVIKRAVDLVKKYVDPKFSIETIPLEDKKVYQEISAGHTVGMFQIEGRGMTELVTKLKPSRFEDIIAVVALFRPGPLGSGMVDDFIERKHGRKKIDYPHPMLESILQDTYGIILYQEQVQKIAATLASYTLGEADLLRRAMGKKKPEEMAKQKSRFVTGCVQNNVPENIADELFELMAKFAEYGFNKSHSAAYGLVSYQTAYMKTYFPEYYMAAIMSCDKDNTDKIVRYTSEVKRMEYNLIPPNVNQSSIDFEVPGPKTLTFGLSAIKGIGEGAVRPIVEERTKNGPFTSISDFAKRVNLTQVGRKTIEILSEVGAFECFGLSRDDSFAATSALVAFSEGVFAERGNGMMTLFNDDEYLQFEMPKSKTTKTFLEWLLKEKLLLGFFLSGHPLQAFQHDVKAFSQFSFSDITDLPSQEREFHVVAFVTAISSRLSAKTQKVVTFYTFEDETGFVELPFFQKETPNNPAPGLNPNVTVNSFVVLKLSLKKPFQNPNAPIKDEKPRLRLESITPLQEFRKKRARSLVLELPVSATSDEKIINLAQEMKKSEGDAPIELRLKYPRGVVSLKTEIKIDPNDTLFIALEKFRADDLKIKMHVGREV